MTISMNNPLKLGTPEAEDFLKSLQGNILRSHGRNEAMHLFISFGSPTDEDNLNSCVRNARTWIGRILDRGDITSAFEEEGSDRSATFQTLLLSSEGYSFLDEKRPKDGSFRDGMRDRGDKLHDPNPTTWETDYRYEDNNKQVHALLIIADKKDEVLKAKTESVKSELTGFGLEVLVADRGHQQLRGGDAIEHFGYRDGVSQPIFIVKDNDDLDSGVKFDQRTPLKRVLEEDRLVKGMFGSYLVYRKLEQDVDSFDAAVENVARELNQTVDFVGAQAVGRFKNGTPLALSGEPIKDYKANGEGRFDYDDDDDGDKCPLHAHIRKANPRNSLGFFVGLFAREKKRRIARRGITYGEKPGKVGLIFICYQADIKDQFEFIQRRWANNHDFSKHGTGLDPVIGQDGGPQEKNDHPKWPTQYASEDRRRIAFGEHIRLRGGEYFFAPSMEGLRKLGTAS